MYATMEPLRMMTCPQVQRPRSKSRTTWDSPSGEMTRDESCDIANEVRQSFAVEERLFSLCHAEGKSLYQQQRYTQKKSEDCAWTPVVDEELLKFLESVEHKAGWIPYLVTPK